MSVTGMTRRYCMCVASTVYARGAIGYALCLSELRGNPSGGMSVITGGHSKI